MIALVLALLAAPVACPKPHRDASVIAKFRKAHPCPASCRTYVKEGGKFRLYRACGACAVDHVCPRAACGKDDVSNLQWLSAEENRRKSDKTFACTGENIDWSEIDGAIAAAARRTDAAKADALRRMREELEEVIRQNRAAFERGER
jgi:hypothetical protein